MLGNGAAILGAGKAMAAKISGDDVVRRPPALLDLAEQADRRLDARAGGQGSRLSAVSHQPPAQPRAGGRELKIDGGLADILRSAVKLKADD
jgi:hypothetical protein